MKTQIAEYSTTAAALADLRTRYSKPFNVTTTQGMEEARYARRELVSLRVALEAKRKELKAPLLERGKLIDEEAKQITTELLKIEEPIDLLIKSEEQRREQEKAEKARAEAVRVACIRAKIDIISHAVVTVTGQPSTVIRAKLAAIAAAELIPADYLELLPEAVKARTETLAALEQMAVSMEAQEAEAARLQAERAELARLQAERERQQAELSAQREEQARIEQAARQQLEAEAARLQAEREALARLRAEEAARRAEEKLQRTLAAATGAARLQAEREAMEQQRAAAMVQLQAEREVMEQQRAELAAKQRALEATEQERQCAKQAAAAATAKKAPKPKVPTDPIADLKQALRAGQITADEAVQQAYDRGFQAGLKVAAA